MHAMPKIYVRQEVSWGGTWLVIYSRPLTIQKEEKIMKLQEVLYNQDNVSGLRKSLRNRVMTM